MNAFIRSNLLLITGYTLDSPTPASKKQKTTKVLINLKNLGGSGKRSDVHVQTFKRSNGLDILQDTDSTLTNTAANKATKATPPSTAVKGTAPDPTASNEEHHKYLERWCAKFIDGGKANPTNVHFTRPRLATQEEKKKARKSLDEAFWVWKCK